MRFLILLTGIFLITNTVSAQKVVVFATDLDSLKKVDTVPHITLYFYRTYINAFVAPMKKTPIYINDTLQYKLKYNSFVALEVYKDGPMVISLVPKDTSIKTTIPINAVYGKEYYFRCWIVPGLGGGKPIMSLKDPKEGAEELNWIKPHPKEKD